MGKWSGESILKTRQCGPACTFFVSGEEAEKIMKGQLSTNVLLKKGLLVRKENMGYEYHSEICVYSGANFKAIVAGKKEIGCFRFKARLPVGKTLDESC